MSSSALWWVSIKKKGTRSLKFMRFKLMRINQMGFGFVLFETPRFQKEQTPKKNTRILRFRCLFSKWADYIFIHVSSVCVVTVAKKERGNGRQSDIKSLQQIHKIWSENIVVVVAASSSSLSKRIATSAEKICFDLFYFILFTCFSFSTLAHMKRVSRCVCVDVCDFLYRSPLVS